MRQVWVSLQNERTALLPWDKNIVNTLENVKKNGSALMCLALEIVSVQLIHLCLKSCFVQEKKSTWLYFSLCRGNQTCKQAKTYWNISSCYKYFLKSLISKTTTMLPPGGWRMKSGTRQKGTTTVIHLRQRDIFLKITFKSAARPYHPYFYFNFAFKCLLSSHKSVLTIYYCFLRCQLF